MSPLQLPCQRLVSKRERLEHKNTSLFQNGPLPPIWRTSLSFWRTLTNSLSSNKHISTFLMSSLCQGKRNVASNNNRHLKNGWLYKAHHDYLERLSAAFNLRYSQSIFQIGNPCQLMDIATVKTKGQYVTMKNRCCFSFTNIFQTTHDKLLKQQLLTWLFWLIHCCSQQMVLLTNKQCRMTWMGVENTIYRCAPKACWLLLHLSSKYNMTIDHAIRSYCMGEIVLLDGINATIKQYLAGCMYLVIDSPEANVGDKRMAAQSVLVEKAS